MDLSLTDDIYGMAALVVGISFLFFGIRLFKTTIATVGGIVFGLGMFALIGLVEDEDFLNDLHSENIKTGSYLVFCCISTIMGGILALRVWKIALLALGSMSGFFFATYVYTMGAYEMDDLSKQILFGGCSVIGGLLTMVFERTVIVVATSFLGSISLCSGIDIFAKTGFNKSMVYLVFTIWSGKLDEQDFQRIFHDNMIICSSGVIGIIGVVIQLLFTGKGVSSYSTEERKRSRRERRNGGVGSESGRDEEVLMYV